VAGVDISVIGYGVGPDITSNRRKRIPTGYNWPSDSDYGVTRPVYINNDHKFGGCGVVRYELTKIFLRKAGYSFRSAELGMGKPILGGSSMPNKILIVDDQKGVRRLLEELFKKEGWSVYIASDGLEAINMVQEIIPDIVLMDMKMPNMNGLESSTLILKQFPDMIIIMMTAYGEMDVVKKALEAGVKRCITKPFDILSLRDLVNELVMDKVS